MMAMISPACPAATASGFMIANVRSMSDYAFHLFADFRGCGAYRNAGRLHRRDLVLGPAAAAGNDGARVAHAAARGRGLPGDKSDHRLSHVFFYVGCGGFLGVAADLTDHYD